MSTSALGTRAHGAESEATVAHQAIVDGLSRDGRALFRWLAAEGRSPNAAWETSGLDGDALRNAYAELHDAGLVRSLPSVGEAFVPGAQLRAHRAAEAARAAELESDPPFHVTRLIGTAPAEGDRQLAWRRAAVAIDTFVRDQQLARPGARVVTAGAWLRSKPAWDLIHAYRAGSPRQASGRGLH